MDQPQAFCLKPAHVLNTQLPIGCLDLLIPTKMTLNGSIIRMILFVILIPILGNNNGNNSNTSNVFPTPSLNRSNTRTIGMKAVVVGLWEVSVFQSRGLNPKPFIPFQTCKLHSIFPLALPPYITLGALGFRV